MNIYLKNLFSAFLIIVGLLLIFNPVPDKVPDLSIPPSPLLPAPVDLSPFENEIHSSYNDFESKILPLIVLNRNACSPCITNVIDYMEIFKTDNMYLHPLLAFVQEKEDEIQRFLTTTGLEIPYVIVETPVLRESKQNVILVDTQKEMAFFNKPIPSTLTTQLNFKSNQLQNAVKKMYSTNPYK